MKPAHRVGVPMMMMSVAAGVRRLYKYTTPQVAALMTQHGSVRVGTLHEYSCLEGTDVRGDGGEGTRIATSAPDPTTYPDGSHVHAWLQAIGIQVQGSIFSNGPNAAVNEEHHADCFLFCASERLSHELIQRFGGACVEINDPAGFFCVLDEGLRTHSRSLDLAIGQAAIDRCMYVPRRNPYFSQPSKHPCFIKPPEFSAEAEIRAVWVPNGAATVAPVVLELPDLVRYLSLTSPAERTAE